MSREITSMKPQQPSGGHLNSIDETARRLGVSTFTIRRLIKDGRLKSVRISRRVMISESNLEAAIENGIE